MERMLEYSESPDGISESSPEEDPDVPVPVPQLRLRSLLNNLYLPDWSVETLRHLPTLVQNFLGVPGGHYAFMASCRRAHSWYHVRFDDAPLHVEPHPAAFVSMGSSSELEQ